MTKKQEDLKEYKELTFGEQLVGIKFNPSEDEKVGKVKALFAEAADILRKDVYAVPPDITEIKKILFEHAIGEILNAQMVVVKVLTLKY